MAGEEIKIIGAAKLETGVHAMGQVANFTTSCDKKEYEIKHYLNQYLPRDIAVTQVDEVPERFHSSLNAASYVYEYRITMGEVANVFERKYNYYSFHRLDVSAMRQAVKEMVGVHDFKALANHKKMKKSTIREVESIEVLPGLNQVTIRIIVDDAWPYMIRKLVAVLMEVGRGSMTKEKAIQLIDAGDATKLALMAEPQGLFLVDVNYR